MYICGGVYEARRLLPPQNLGPGGASPEFLPSNAVRHIPQVDAFVGIKNTKIDFGWGFTLDLTG